MEKTPVPVPNAGDEADSGGEQEIYDIFKTPSKPPSGANKINTPGNNKTRKTPKRKCAEEERARTPSGQLLTTNVGQIKRLIEAKSFTQPHKLAKVDEIDTSSWSFDFTRRRSTGTINFPLNEPKYCHLSPVNMIKDRSDDSVCEPDNVLNAKTTENATSEGEKEDANITSKLEQTIKEQIVMTQQHITSQDGGSNPTVIDARSVVTMLESLRSDLTKQMENLSIGGDEAVARQLSDRVLELERKLQIAEAKERMMVDTMARMSDLITELQMKNEKYDIEKAKRMAILSGFEGSSKKGICIKQIQDFISAEVGLNLSIDDIFYIGEAKEIVIIFSSIEHKRQTASF